jgi:hypothetical protein
VKGAHRGDPEYRIPWGPVIGVTLAAMATGATVGLILWLVTRQIPCA